MPRSELSRVFDHQPRQRNLAIGNVVIDMLGQEILTGLIYFNGFNCSTSRQFGDDMVALGICVRIRGVSDLKSESS